MLPEEAEEIVITKCKETSSEYFNVKDFLTADLTKAKIFSDSHTVHLNPPLKGSYQKKNAALAALTISKTLQLQNEQNYLNGISKVRANTGLQGRYEYYSRNPTIIFDSAHNPEGVTAFLNEFDNEPGNFKRKILIFGAMRDKAISEMLLSLTKYFDEILLAEINYERAAKQEDLKNLCNNLKIGARIIERPAKFIRDFILNSNEECLVVIGSMYLLGEIKQQLLYDGT
jgi:dihydrofolate synthase/folylpolyglutamate synthase